MVIIGVHRHVLTENRKITEQLSAARQQHAETVPAQRELRLCAGLALDACLKTVGLREKTVETAIDLHGKPYFPQYPEWHFSLSHSGDWAVCALADLPVGVDIEQWRLLDIHRLAKRYFTPAEQEWMNARDEQAFFTLWTAKESLIKVRGCGLSGLASAKLTLCGDTITAEPNLQFRKYPIAGYSLIVCGEKNDFSEKAVLISSCNNDLLR